MTTASLLATASAWTNDQVPHRNYHGAPVLYVSSGSVLRRGWVWFARPVPLGATVQSATLTLTFGNGWAGASFHLEVLRIIQAWKASKVTDSNAPDLDTVDTGDDLSDLAQNEAVEIDVTAVIQDVADGAPWFGFEIGVTSGAAQPGQVIFGHAALAQERRPALEVVYALTPSAPTDLVPSSGHVVGPVRPTLAWTFRSPDPGAIQAWSQVQVDDDPLFGSALWDSGMVANTLAQATMGADTVAGTTYYWRVKVKDTAGLESDWSDVASFSRVAKPTVTITNPAADGDDTPDSTPTLAHTVTGGTQVRVQRMILDASGVVVHDTGEVVSAELLYEVPPGAIVLAETDYTAVVRVWDDVDREATPGDPAYTEARRVFQYVPSADVLPVALVSATLADGPGVLVGWRYLGTAEAFALVMDGEIVADRIVPTDVGTGVDYELIYWRAPLGLAHTFEVRAIVFDAGIEKHSTDNPTATITLSPTLMWIVRPSTDEAIPVWGDAEPDTQIGEDAQVYRPIGRTGGPIVTTSFLGGLEATLEGFLLDDEHGGPTARDYAATLRDWIDLAGGDELRIAYGPRNLPVTFTPGKGVVAMVAGGYSIAIPFAQAGAL